MNFVLLGGKLSISSDTTKSVNTEKKHPWSRRDVYNAMFVEFAIDKDLVTLKEAGNLYQKHVMTDHSSGYEQELHDFMKSKNSGKMMILQPALNRGAKIMGQTLMIKIK